VLCVHTGGGGGGMDTVIPSFPPPVEAGQYGTERRFYCVGGRLNPP